MNTNVTKGFGLDSIEDFEFWLDSLDVPDITLVDDEMNLWAIASGFIHPLSSNSVLQA